MAKLTVDELKQTLKSDVGFTDDQLTGLSKAQLEKLADAYMRQSDYDRLMNEGKAELTKAQSDLEAANTRLNAEMAEWAQVQAGTKTATVKMQQDLEAAQMRVAQLTQRVQRIAVDAGMDPNKALEGVEPVQQPEKPTGPDLSGFVRADDVNKQFGQLADMSLSLPAMLDDLRDEHHDLFGKRLNTQDIIKELKTRAATPGNQKSLDPRAIWEEMHKVADRRQEVQAAELAKIKQAEYDRGREAALSEIQVPGAHSVPGKTHGPLFREQRTSKLQRPQPESSVMAAAGAFRSGKYRKTGAGT